MEKSIGLGLLIVIAVLLSAIMPTVPLVSRSQSLEAPGPTFIAASYWGVSANQTLLASPGSFFMPLTVVLYYLGPVTLYNVSVRFNASYPLIPVKGQGTLQELLPAMQPGDSIRLVGLFNVSPSAQPGIYNESLNVSYTVVVRTPTGENLTLSLSQEVKFKVPIVGFQSVRLVTFSTTPLAVYSGMSAAGVSLYLENQGTSTATNVTLIVRPVAGAYVLGSGIYNLGYLPPGKVVNITVPLGIVNETEVVHYGFGHFTVPKPHEITLAVSVYYGGHNYTYYIDVPVRPSAYFALINASHPQLRIGGSDEYVTVGLANVGLYNADFVTVTLLPNPILTPYIPSSENPLLAPYFTNITVGDISNGTAFNVTFVVSVSNGIRPGTYYLPLLITWYQPPTMQVMHQVVLVPVKVSPAFSISLPSGSGSNYMLYLVAIIVIVVIIVMAIVGARKR